ncbi:MAG: DUF6194 family protein [Legionellaceae bacterium]|nr:DUF6194 family protein [Legionellaceae bacterium]
MTVDELIQRIKLKYPMLSENKNWGERGLFYNPHQQFPKGAYVLTFKEKDGQNDTASHLNTGNKYRLNLKVSKKTFIQLFNTLPKRPAAGRVIDGGYDFTELDTVMPHPIYGWMTWVGVLNPTIQTIERMEAEGLFEEAYLAAVATINKKLKISQNTI